MANISLTPGEPITYDLIQNIIESINRLERVTNQNSTKPTKKAQAVKVAGTRFRDIDNVTILCGSEVFDIDQKQTYNTKIKFDGASFGSVPHVVVSVADVDGRGSDTINPPYATLSIGSVSKTEFSVRVDIIKVSAKNTKLKVNYIAVGKG
jgi:hypothetical protein